MQSGAESKTKRKVNSAPTNASIPKNASTRSLAAAFALLVLVAAFAYRPALHGDFIWDDDDYVTQNPTLTSADGLRRIWLEPGAVPQYYPMVHTTFWIERHLWGLDPLGFHIVNLVLHLSAAFLLMVALRRMAIPGAFFAAALFALHPVHVESVAWVTERKNVLSAVFYLGSLLAWLRFSPLLEAPDHAEQASSLRDDRAHQGSVDRSGQASGGGIERSGQTPDDRRSAIRRAAARNGTTGSWGWYALSLALFACAIFSKTVTGSLPAAILILTWWRRGRIGKADLTLVAPFFLLAAGMGAITIWMERLHVGATGPEFDLSFADRSIIAGKALWFYLTKLIVPFDLSFVYTRWEIDSRDLVQFIPVVGALVLIVVLYLARRRIGRAPLAAALFFGVTLFPALGFINVYPMRFSFVADHFQYLASLGPIVLFVSAVARFARSRSSRTISMTTASVLALTLAVLAHDRAKVFANQETLWLDTLEKNEQSWLAHNNLGKYYEDQGRIDVAEKEYQKAHAIRPDLDLPLYNLGGLAQRRGDVSQAIAYFERALEANPTIAEAHLQLGNVYRGIDRRLSLEHYRMAMELDSTSTALRRQFAFALAEVGNVEGAIEQLRRVVRRNRSDLSAMTRLAWLLATAPDARVRDGEEAARWAEEACRRSGYDDPEHLASLAAAQAELARFEEAANTASRAAVLARSAGQQQAASTLESQSELYRSGRTISSVLANSPGAEGP